MNNWEDIVEKFLSDWRKKGEYLGAILVGSYAVGAQTAESDVDVMIVLSDSAKYWERGNLVIDGVSVEYIADPVSMWRKSFEEELKNGKRVSVNMFANGKVIEDGDGVVAALKTDASEKWNVPVEEMNLREIEMSKYILFEGLDKLKVTDRQSSPALGMLYHLQLNRLIEVYARYQKATLPAVSKYWKFIDDSSFRERYSMIGFGDAEFVNQVRGCFSRMNVGEITNLTNYVIEKLGGFDETNWSLRTEIVS